MYTVEKAGREFNVVNVDTGAIQSAWREYTIAAIVCRSLNVIVARESETADEQVA